MKPKILMGAALVCVAASVAMYVIGGNSSHMSELKDFFYVPLPLAAVLGALGMKGGGGD